MKTIYLWQKAKKLNAVSQKNKQNRMLCSILQFTKKFTSKNLLGNFNF